MRLSHVGWSLGGLVLPLGVAAVTVPHLVASLGQERFGLLALAWGLIGYAGAMDLGLGRALTQLVSRMLGEKNLAAIPDALATAGKVTLFSGVAGGALIAATALCGGYRWVHVADTPQGEVLAAMLLLAIALPAQAMSGTYRGLNEAFLNFKGTSLLRAALGAVNFAGPFAVSFFTIKLPWLVATLVVSRMIALVVYRWLAVRCLASEAQTRRAGRYSKAVARALFSFGGWVTVSSLVSPVLVQADRFVIASSISAAAVAVYVLPYEVVVQSLVLVGAVTSVMFPGLSKLVHESPQKWRAYFDKWFVRVVALMAVVCGALAALLPTILPLWIKGRLDPVSVSIGQVLCLGVFANAIGAMFYALLHAQGRSSVTAKLHLVELPLFLLALSTLVAGCGVMGAAYAWVCRMIFDSVALALLARRS